MGGLSFWEEGGEYNVKEGEVVMVAWKSKEELSVEKGNVSVCLSILDREVYF